MPLFKNLVKMTSCHWNFDKSMKISEKGNKKHYKLSLVLTNAKFVSKHLKMSKIPAIVSGRSNITRCFVRWKQIITYVFWYVVALLDHPCFRLIKSRVTLFRTETLFAHSYLWKRFELKHCKEGIPKKHGTFGHWNAIKWK